jgi:hypothetical protein
MMMNMNARGLLTVTIGCAAVVTVTTAERRTSLADYGDRWPFTVNDGVLSCVGVGQMVNFRVGAITYAVNGIAKGHGNPDVEAIWSTRPVSPPKDVVARLPEPRRRELFRARVACPEQAERAAERKFPGASSLSELKSSAVYGRKMLTRCNLAGPRQGEADRQRI